METLLSQTDGQWNDVISAVDDDDDLEENPDGEDLEEEEAGELFWVLFPRRVTVREVLKYSRTPVITPLATVQAWTQEMEQSRSQPSTRTVGPKEAMDWGKN